MPLLGEISPFFGQLGVRQTDGDRIECHVCGEWLRRLAGHTVFKHGITAYEYKAAFGLTHKGLVGEGLHATLSAKARARGLNGVVFPYRATNEQLRQQAEPGRRSLEQHLHASDHYARIVKSRANNTPEARAKRSASLRNFQAGLPADQRGASLRAYQATLTPDERRRAATHASHSRSPEQRAAAGRAAHR